MVWGAKARGVEDLTQRLRDGSGGDAMLVMSNRAFGKDEEALAGFCAALGENVSVRELLCSGHTLSPAGAALVAGALRRNKGLKRLSIGCANFGDEAARALLDDWQNETLEHLDLELKSLGAPAMEGIRGVLCSPLHGLQELLLGRNEIGDAGMAVLASGVKCSAQLVRLDLRANGIGAAGAGMLGQALQTGCKRPAGLRIVLDQNPLGSAGVAALVAAPPTEGGDSSAGAALDELSLVACEVDDAGAAALADALCGEGACFPPLRLLRLGRNNITDGSWAARVLSHSESKLSALFLDHNAIGANGVASLAAGLARADGDPDQPAASSLQLLDLSGVGLGEGQEDLLATLACIPGLRELQLLGNKVGDAGAGAIGAALRGAHDLEILGLGGIGLTAEGCGALLASLESNEGLKTLVLGGNDLGEEGRLAVEAFRENVRPELDIAMDKNVGGGEGEEPHPAEQAAAAAAPVAP